MIPLTLLNPVIGGYDLGENIDLSGISTHLISLLLKEKLNGSNTITLKSLLLRCKHLTLKKEELSRFYTILVKSRIWSETEFYRAFLKYYILNKSDEAKIVLNRAIEWAKDADTDFLSFFFLKHLKKKANGKPDSAIIVKFFFENPFTLKPSFRSIETLMRLVNNGADINSSLFFGSPFLRWSLETGHISVFEDLISRKARISCLFNPSPTASLIHYLKNKTNCPPSLTPMDCIHKLIELYPSLEFNESLATSLLEKAIFSQDVNFVQDILKKGANPNILNSEGMTPLLLASSMLFTELNNQIQIIGLLLDHGANLLAVSHTAGSSALHFMCCQQAYLESIEYLLRKNFPVDLEDKYGLTPFDYAVKNENITIMLKLIEYGSCGMNKYSNEDLLYIVEDQQSISLMKKLLERGCPIDALLKPKTTLLLQAAHGKNLEWVKFLIENKANVNVSSLSGNTPLMKSIDVDFAVTRCLIENGAKLFALKENGKCAADYLFLIDIPKVVEYLACTFLDVQQLQAFMPFPLNIYGLKEFNKEVMRALEFKSPKLPSDLFPFLCFSVLFNFSDLTYKIIQSIPSNKLKDTLVRLYKVFPELLENTPYLIKHMMCLDKKHLVARETTIKVPPAPEGATVERLLDLFVEINFSDPSKNNYINPAKIFNENGTLMTPEVLRECLELLCNHVKLRKARVGTPPPDTPEIKVFYAKLENYLKHISFQLNKMENTSERGVHLIDIALAAEFCGMRWLGDAFDKYNHLCNPNHFPTFKDQVYDTLTRFRSGLVSIISGDDVHDHSRAIRILGEVLGLPGSQDMAEINDRLRPNEEGMPFKYMYRDFLKVYSPHRIYATVETFLNELMKKSPELLHGWLRDNFPEEWRKEYFINLKNSLSEGEQSLDHHNDILKQHGIPYLKNLADLDKHLFEYKMATFFEDDFYDFKHNCIKSLVVVIVARGLNILSECRWGILEILNEANACETENRKEMAKSIN